MMGFSVVSSGIALFQCALCSESKLRKAISYFTTNLNLAKKSS